MAFKIIFGDICKVKADAIVNSLGTNAQILGAVCRKIYERSKSIEIKKLLWEKTNNKVFDIFITDAGKLPAQNVIHIVSPFKYSDTNENSNLQKAYDLVICEAINRGYKSIAIPFLGTGANGYKNSDVYSAATTVASKYVTEDGMNEVIDIILVNYNSKDKDISLEEAMMRRNRINDERLMMCGAKKTQNNLYMPSHVKNSTRLNTIFSTMSESEMFIPLDNIKYPMDFIDQYMSQNNISKSEYFKDVLSKDNSSRCRTGKRTLKKKDIYRSCVFLGWTNTVLLQAMSYAGYSFCPTDKGDVDFVKYLSLKKRAKDILDFQDNFTKYLHCIYDSE